MDWFYAEGQEKRGPLPEAQMRALVAADTIKPGTLVWNAGLTQWKPARDTALFAAAAAAPGTEPQRCIITGKLYPVSQMIQTERGWVSVEGKDVYYQSLREGAPIPVAEGVSNARRDGKKFVVPLAGPQLPARCVKTGEPTGLDGIKPKTLYWCTPWVFLAFIIIRLLGLILYFVLRKKIVLHIPISPAGKTRMRKHGFIATGICLGGVALGVLGAMDIDHYFWLLILGIFALLVGLFYASFKASALRVTKLKNGEAWLAGACPEFLAALPPYA